jgi:Na+/melibiose symporter-like transporter
LRARPDAPFSVLNLSPAPLVIVCGVMLVKLFMIWTHKRRAEGRSPLIALEMIVAPRERSALFSIFTISAVSSGITFLIPLYIEIVQGRNSLYTAIAMVPFTLSSVAAAFLVSRLRGRVRPRLIARYGFLIVAAGLTILGATIRNDWSDTLVMFSMVVAGLGEGALATLLFEALITAAPAEVAQDVEPLCDATSHLAMAVGTALAGALVIGVLSFAVHRDLALNPVVANELRAHLNLDRVAFVSNDHLRQKLEGTTATPEQVAEALRINTQARLRALKVSFFALAALALLAFIPSGGVRDDGTVTKAHEGRLESQKAGVEPKATSGGSTIS